jgi:hypothetical protein
LPRARRTTLEKIPPHARPNGTRIPFDLSDLHYPSRIEKSHLGPASICHKSRLIAARSHVGDIETATTNPKHPSVSAVVAKAIRDWPVVVLGIAASCTVAWASFLIWLMTYLLRLAFA